MRRPALPVGGWIAAVCLFGTAAWSCSEDATNLFDESSGGGASGTAGTETGGGGSAGSSTGGATGGSPTGGSSGSSTAGDATGGTPTGGTTGDGGAAAESGSDAGGTTTGGSGGTPSGAGAGGSNAGSGGTPGMGGAGVGGTLGGAGAGAGMGGGGMGGGGKSGGKAGSGGAPGSCQNDANCNQNEYCKKATCDAPSGSCTPRGPECRGANAEFEPVCGCDGITYWNTCAIEHEGFNVALHGECTGNNRPTCTRDAGGDSCPERANARCYRPVDECGTTSPTMGVCWVLPAECPANEAQTQRYCGGTAGSARCIGFCEVIEAENSFQRDAERCAN